MTSSSFKSVVFLFALLGGLAVILQGCGGDDDDDKDDTKKTPDNKPDRKDIDIECDKGGCKITRKCSGDLTTITWTNCANGESSKEIPDDGCTEFDKLAAKGEQDMEDWKTEECEEAGKAKDEEDGNVVSRNVKCTDTCSVKYSCDKTKSLVDGEAPGVTTVTREEGCAAKADPTTVADNDPAPCKHLEEQNADEEGKTEEQKIQDNKAICDEAMGTESDPSKSPGETPDPDNGNAGDEAVIWLTREVNCDPSECIITIQCNPKGSGSNLKKTYTNCKVQKGEETEDDDKCTDFTKLNDENDADGALKAAEKERLCGLADGPADETEKGNGDGGNTYLTATAKETPASQEVIAKSVDEPSQTTVV